MEVVKYINPEGQEVSVPASDAEHFDAIGWPRVEEKDEAPAKRGRKAQNEQ